MSDADTKKRIEALRKRVASNKAKAKKRLAAIDRARYERRVALENVQMDQAEIRRLGGKVGR